LRKLNLLLIILILPVTGTYAQNNVKDSAQQGAIIEANFSYNLPGADLKKRFGSNLGAGLGFMYKSRNNLLIGAQANYFFGNTVNEDSLFKDITSANNKIIGSQGIFADIVLQERGFYIALKAGKIFPIIGPNPNSGLVLIGGVGILQHKIRIEYLENDSDNKVPQLEGDYRKGYDRLSNGLAFNEFIGYFHSSNKQFVNFYFGIEFIQGFTKSRRSWNIDEQKNRNSIAIRSFAWIQIRMVLTNLQERSRK